MSTVLSFNDARAVAEQLMRLAAGCARGKQCALLSRWMVRRENESVTLFQLRKVQGVCVLITASVCTNYCKCVTVYYFARHIQPLCVPQSTIISHLDTCSCFGLSHKAIVLDSCPF